MKWNWLEENCNSDSRKLECIAERQGRWSFDYSNVLLCNIYIYFTWHRSVEWMNWNPVNDINLGVGCYFALWNLFQVYLFLYSIDFSLRFQLCFLLEAKTCQYTADEVLWQRQAEKYISCSCYLCHVMSFHMKLDNRLSEPFPLHGLEECEGNLITSGVQLTDQRCYQFTVTPESIENLLQSEVTWWTAAIYSWWKFIFNYKCHFCFILFFLLLMHKNYTLYYSILRPPTSCKLNY